MLSKNVKKKCAPKLVFFNEKKIEKDSDDFWRRKLTFKVFWHFLTPPHYTNSQMKWFSLAIMIFSQKSFNFFYTSLENSTIPNNIMVMVNNPSRFGNSAWGCIHPFQFKEKLVKTRRETNTFDRLIGRL